MENDTDLKFGTYTPIDHIQKLVFLFFRKNNPEGRLPRKTAVSRRFSAYLFDCLVLVCSTFTAPQWEWNVCSLTLRLWKLALECTFNEAVRKNDNNKKFANLIYNFSGIFRNFLFSPFSLLKKRIERKKREWWPMVGILTFRVSFASIVKWVSFDQCTTGQQWTTLVTEHFRAIHSFRSGW